VLVWLLELHTTGLEGLNRTYADVGLSHTIRISPPGMIPTGLNSIPFLRQQMAQAELGRGTEATKPSGMAAISAGAESKKRSMSSGHGASPEDGHRARGTGHGTGW
jgi:hypothetical protein